MALDKASEGTPGLTYLLCVQSLTQVGPPPFGGEGPCLAGSRSARCERTCVPFPTKWFPLLSVEPPVSVPER